MSKDIKNLLANRSPSNRIVIAPHNLKQTAEKPEEKPVPAVTQPESPAAVAPRQDKPAKKAPQPPKAKHGQSAAIKYTTHLTTDIIKKVKLHAIEHDTKDYDVVQEALEQFFKSK